MYSGNILDFIVVLLILITAVISAIGIGRRRAIFPLFRVVRAYRILRSVRLVLVLVQGYVFFVTH